MKKAVWRDQYASVFALLLYVVLAVTGLHFFTGGYRVPALLCAAAVISLLATRDLSALRHPIVLLLLGYVIVAGLSGFWAVSGKFFLNEYVNIFVAACGFVAVLLIKNFDRSTVRKLFAGVAGVAAVYSFLSVEYVTTGVTKAILLALIPNMAGVNVSVEEGTRLFGIFGSPNSTASVLALSIFFGIHLMVEEEDRRARMYCAVALALNAFAFLSMFSMAATGFFALSLLVYLAAAGKKRAASFVSMLVGALPTLVWVFAAFPFLTAQGALKCVPLLAMAANVASVILLDRMLSAKLIPVLEKHVKLVIAAIFGLILLAVVYVAAAMNLSTAYTFGTDLTRSIYPQPGSHTLSVQATGDVTCHVYSQNEAETIMHTNTPLYSGAEKEITLEVPEGSKVCYITFQAEPGVILEHVLVDGTEDVKLEYSLLPDFISNRLQGLWANQNAIQRTAFFDDGLKLFMLHPLHGFGVGSFETALTSVQEFYYETKYIHNHYIQVLEECGILGFLPFLGSMLGLIFLLWKKRGQEKWTFRNELAPLCAAMTMTLTHIAFEFSMSDEIFLCSSYITFAIIIRCCTFVEPEAETDRKKSVPAKNTELVFRTVCVALPAVFAASVCCNMFAEYLMNKPVASEDEFMQNLSTAAMIDPYEKNDAKLSYVMASLQMDGGGRYRAAANNYAAELQQVHSNTIPKVLTEYYLATSQPYQAVEAAMAGASYSASDAATWNDTVSIFRGYLFNPTYTPLYDDGANLSAALLTYYDAAQQYNSTSMQDIDLNPASKDFFGKLRSIAGGSGSAEEVAAVLTEEVFRLSTACDANQDSIADQVTWFDLASFQPDGSIAADAGAQIRLELYSEKASGTMRVTVSASAPADLVLLRLSDGLSVQPQAVTADGCAVFDLPVESTANTVAMQLDSYSAQSIQSLDVEWIS